MNNLFDSVRFRKQIFNPATADYNALIGELFHYQIENNQLYRNYCQLVGRTNPPGIQHIPLLPIRFFKSHDVRTGNFKQEPSLIFTSSGTSSSQTSKHLVFVPEIYRESFLTGFHHFYGNPFDYVFLALLPGYLERKGSSLIYMMEELIKLSDKKESGFYLDEHEKLFHLLNELDAKKQKTILMGVSFALLDFCEKYSLKLNHTTIMETGGMKGRKKEMTRTDLHAFYKEKFGVNAIHSEFGMTELLSQAYSRGDGKFFPSPWMKIVITAIDDPFAFLPIGQSGRINVIDLANIFSCAFIATDDLGKINPDGSFEVLGRIDNSDMRGCNLLIS